AIIDWRDEDDFVYGEEDFGRARGAENAYYQGLVPPYSCKNKDFEILEELLLVKGVTHKLYYGKDEDGKIKYALKDFLTVYGEGSVNINTAPEPVLSALFGEDFKELASKVCAYRRGADGIIGTKDDRWFSIGSYAIDRQDMGLVAVKNLKDPDWLGNMYGITNDEYARIKKMISSGDIKLCAKSDIYRAYSTGKVRKVMTEIEAVYKFSEDEDYPRLLFWHEQ
ncbi:MAG TPA: hypothetical protein ENN78_00130, partial [Candidatus Omnitrophica bacterium]|nr:hypothetical protein [Candidatus Omnitrophota bacterium]